MISFRDSTIYTDAGVAGVTGIFLGIRNKDSLSGSHQTHRNAGSLMRRRIAEVGANVGGMAQQCVCPVIGKRPAHDPWQPEVRREGLCQVVWARAGNH